MSAASDTAKPLRFLNSRRLVKQMHLMSHLQATQEVVLLDGLSSGLASTLGYLRALVRALGGIVHGILGEGIAVVGGGCDVVGVVVGRDLGGQDGGASGELLLVAFPLLLVQGWKMLDGKETVVSRGLYVLLGSTPPFSVLDCLLESPRRSHNQSGYSESSFANTSGLFLK